MADRKFDEEQRRRANPARPVIGAAISLLARLESAEADEPTYPDETNRSTRDIDATVRIGTKDFAIEHTRVQQFEGATEEREFIERHRGSFEDLHDRVLKQLPANSYHLEVIGPTSARRRDLPRLLQDLATEVCATAGQLAAPPSSGNIRLGTVSRRSAWVRYRLIRGFASEGPDLRISFVRPYPAANEKEARRAVVRRLVEAKCSKLAPYKERGYSTVLLLENAAFMATPYSPLLLAEEEVRARPSNTTDMLIAVSREPDIWDLQYVKVGEFVSRDLLRTNWWVYDPVTRVLVWKPWELGSRRALLEGMQRPLASG